VRERDRQCSFSVGAVRHAVSGVFDRPCGAFGKWFGLSDTDLLNVLPNLKNWDVSKRNLGFV